MEKETTEREMILKPRTVAIWMGGVVDVQAGITSHHWRTMTFDGEIRAGLRTMAGAEATLLLLQSTGILLTLNMVQLRADTKNPIAMMLTMTGGEAKDEVRCHHQHQHHENGGAIETTTMTITTIENTDKSLPVVTMKSIIEDDGLGEMDRDLPVRMAVHPADVVDVAALILQAGGDDHCQIPGVIPVATTAVADTMMTEKNAVTARLDRNPATAAPSLKRDQDAIVVTTTTTTMTMTRKFATICRLRKNGRLMMLQTQNLR